MIPIGGIAGWSGTITDIPIGWQLCDGTNGTPDLRNRFIYGAEVDMDVGTTGGTSVHDHEFTGDGHAHPSSAGVDITGSGPQTAWPAPADSGDRAAAVQLMKQVAFLRSISWLGFNECSKLL